MCPRDNVSTLPLRTYNSKAQCRLSRCARARIFGSYSERASVGPYGQHANTRFNVTRIPTCIESQDWWSSSGNPGLIYVLCSADLWQATPCLEETTARINRRPDGLPSLLTRPHFSFRNWLKPNFVVDTVDQEECNTPGSCRPLARKFPVGGVIPSDPCKGPGCISRPSG